MSAAAATITVPSARGILQQARDYVLPIGAISVIFVMLIPLPAAVLDLLLAISMAASVIVFLSSVQIRRAVELSVFPTLLLLLTMFRLALNIASSRRILQLSASQTELMQADLATVATQLSLTKTQQTALESVIVQLGSGSLFDKLQ